MKTCFKCGIAKPLEEFYKHKAMADGHLGKCKDCAKSDVRHHYRIDIERSRAINRKRSHEPANVVLRRERTRQYRQTRPEAFRGAKARWAKRNKAKRQAHDKVRKAVRKGLLNRPTFCESCGLSLRLEAHHDDYSKPLEVLWLCRQCHGRRHHKSNEAA